MYTFILSFFRFTINGSVNFLNVGVEETIVIFILTLCDVALNLHISLFVLLLIIKNDFLFKMNASLFGAYSISSPLES